MILKHSKEIPAQRIDRTGFSNMKAKFMLIAQDGCPRYAMRLMEIGPGGHTSYHNHLEEHEMFFLEGEGTVTGEDGVEILIGPGDVLYIEPCENHQLVCRGSKPLKLICTVPIFPGKDGKVTTPCDNK